MVALLVGVVVVIAAVAGGALLVADNGSPAVAISSPVRANSALYAAALASGSFHYRDVSSGTVGGHAVTAVQSGDDGRTAGVQYMTSSLGDYEVIVVDSMAYMKPDLTMLEDTFGLSPSEAAPFVDRWLSFKPSDAPYDSVAADVTTGSTWGNPATSPTEGLPQTPESVSGLSTVNGAPAQSVIYSLHGANAAASASYSGSETITFSAAGPHLPRSLTEQLSATSGQQSGSESNDVTFSRWGEAVDVTAPAGSIPYSTLPTPTATTA